MPKLISAIQDVIKVFQKYSEKDCSQNKLNSEELNLLIQNEFADVIKNPKDPNTISSLLAILDENNDGEVDFNEFCDLLCKVLKAYYKVVYEKEDTCQQPDEPKKNVETTPQATSQTSDEPPNYYQKPLLPKHEKSQSTYHDQKGICAVQRNGGEKNQICTQTDQKTEEKDSTGSQSQDYSQGKDQTSQQDPKESQCQGKEQTSHVDATVSQSHSDSSKDQVQGTSSSQSTSYDQGKDQTSKPTTTSSQSTSYEQGKDQTSKPTTTSSQSTSYEQGKDQTSKPTTTCSQSTSYEQGKDQTSKPTTTSSQSTSYEQGKDQTSKPTTTSSQSTSYEQGKDQTSKPTTTSSQSTSYEQGKDQTSKPTTTSSQSTSYEQGKDQTSKPTTTSSQSTSYEQGKDQTSKPTTTSSQSQGKEQIMMAENTTTVDQPGQTQEAQSFYRKPLYIPPVQSFGVEVQASSQPPSYSQTQQDPTPTCQETPKEPHQSQQNKFYQHQQTFSVDKKNP